MSESPKWLFVNNYYDEVRNIMYDIQIKNGIEEEERIKFVFQEEKSKKEEGKDEETEQLIQSTESTDVPTPTPQD